MSLSSYPPAISRSRRFVCAPLEVSSVGRLLWAQSSSCGLRSFHSSTSPPGLVPHLPATLLSAAIRAALPLLGVVYALACWTFWTGKNSARTWGLVASGANAVLGCLFLYMDRRFLTAPSTAFLNPDALLLGIGIAGLIAFRRHDVIKVEQLMQPLPGDGTNAVVNRAIWIAGTGGFISAMTWWWRWAESNGLVWIRNSFFRDLFLLLLLELLMVAIHEFGHASVASVLDMKLCAFIVGPFQWRLREGKWEFRFILSGFLAIGGATAVAPTDPNRPLWRDISMVAAGPIVSLLSGLAALWFTLTAPGHPWQQDWLPPRLLHHPVPANRRPQPHSVPHQRLLLRRRKDLPIAVARTLGRSSSCLLCRRRHHRYAAPPARLRYRRDRARRLIDIGRPTGATPASPRSVLLSGLRPHRRCQRGPGRCRDHLQGIRLRHSCRVAHALHLRKGLSPARCRGDPSLVGTHAGQTPHPAQCRLLDRQERLPLERNIASKKPAKPGEKGNTLVQQLPHSGAYETDRDQFALLQKELELELSAVAG
jgi:hypothetical protein